MWDLSFLIRNGTLAPYSESAVKAQSLNHWISREAPRFIFNATLPKLLNDKSLYVLNLYEQYKKSMF